MIFQERGLLRRELLDCGIEAGLAPSGIILLYHVLLSGLVECLLGLLEPFFGAGHIGLGDRFTRAFYGALDYALDGAITERILGGDPHVLLG